MDTVYHDKRGYENIIVTFSSGVNRVLGETPKEFSKIITKYNCDILYIYDDILSWYVNGVKGYESVKLLSEHITTIISGYKNSGFLGSSMGGYAAILYSIFCNPNKCLSFCPQTLLQHKKRDLFNDFRFPILEKNGIMSNYYLDLKPFLFKNDFNTIISIIYSGDNKFDLKHAEWVSSSDNITLYPQDSDLHNICGVLKHRGQLYSTIENTFNFLSIN